MNDLEKMLAAIIHEPLAEDRWSVIADWLEEHDDPRRAELLRLHRRLLATCCEPEQHSERDAWQGRVVELLGQGVRPCLPQWTVVLGKGVEMTFSFIPPGTFLMGSPPGENKWIQSDDETRHRATLTRGYWLGIHPVTQSQWKAVMGNNPSQFKGNSLPMVNISWDGWQEFVEKTGERFRLSTEAEWEHACRAGTTTPFFYGETISTNQANYDSNGPVKKGVYWQGTTPVGSFPPNAWGLFDMHGNVWEWCSDWYCAHPSGDSRDPQGSNSGIARVLRGGSWDGGPGGCCSAYRGRNEPGLHYDHCGCRVVLCLDSQP